MKCRSDFVLFFRSFFSYLFSLVVNAKLPFFLRIKSNRSTFHVSSGRSKTGGLTFSNMAEKSKICVSVLTTPGTIAGRLNVLFRSHQAAYGKPAASLIGKLWQAVTTR